MHAEPYAYKQALHVVLTEIFWICFIKHWKPKNQTREKITY